MMKENNGESKVDSLLSERMKAAAALVSEGNRVADIGCDHAYTSIYLVQTGKAPSAIAMDVRKGPLERARANVTRFRITDRISLRLSDGLSELTPGEADTLLFAGMGGPLITELLAAGMPVVKAAKELVLQPQSEAFRVRRFLLQNGFRIDRETMLFEEGKYYVVMRAVPGTEPAYGEEEELFGRCLLKERPDVFLRFLSEEEKKTEELLSELSGQTSEKSEKRRKELSGLRIMLEKLRK